MQFRRDLRAVITVRLRAYLRRPVPAFPPFCLEFLTLANLIATSCGYQ